MDIFNIVLEGVNGYGVGKFWEDEASEMYASRGGNTCVLSWKPNGIYIVGGLNLAARVDACLDIGVAGLDRSSESRVLDLKNLCWAIVIESMTPELLQKALDEKFDQGVYFGDRSRLDKIRKALALEINS